MTNITSTRWLYIKCGLFLVLGLASGLLLFLQVPELRTAFLLAVCIWAFSRAYYFAFYVVQHYVDPGFQFAGLFDFFKYAIRTWRASR